MCDGYGRNAIRTCTKSTLPPTKVKPVVRKKTKRRSKEEILLAREKEKRAALKKAVQKQKDFLNHQFGED